MSDNKFIAWTAFTLLVLAVAVTVLVIFSPILERYNIVSSEGVLWVIGALALLATVTGFVAFKTPQGKVAAIGGLLLLIAIVFVTPVRTVTSAPRAEPILLEIDNAAGEMTLVQISLNLPHNQNPGKTRRVGAFGKVN